jgi:2-amino-4-hydroxy-6-hydroxymethyldihydropteridine diphosphokinase
MPEVFVAAGSNVRPRVSLGRALAMLAREFPGLRASRSFSNAAVGFEGDDFLNLVVSFPTSLAAEDVLRKLKDVERASGRPPGAAKWGPRTLDLDLLLYGGYVGRVAGKAVPHPDLLTRAWVLGPLAELAPGLVHPVVGESFGELWRRFDKDAHPLEPVELAGAGE